MLNARLRSSTKKKTAKVSFAAVRTVYGSRAGNALDGRPVLDLLLIAYGLIFNTVQANSVAHALRFAFNCPEWLTGGALALLTLLTIVTGLKGLPA